MISSWQSSTTSSDFDSYLGMARAYFQQGKAGDAYVIAETNALPLAKANDTKAKVYYWESIFLEGMKDNIGEQASWNRLIALPPDVMPPEWRDGSLQTVGHYCHPHEDPSTHTYMDENKEALTGLFYNKE